MLEPFPTILIVFQLIKGGSKTALNQHYNYHDSFITFQRLEYLHVAMPATRNHTSFGVKPGDHYMSVTKVPLG
jgi:hypothetical protein